MLPANLPYKEILFAALGTCIGLLLMRMEDKFYNRQYTNTQYTKLGAGFFVTCLAVVYANKIIGQTPLLISTTGPQTITANQPIVSDSRSVFTPISMVNNMKFQSGVPNF
jgi:hypothetical protein